MPEIPSFILERAQAQEPTFVADELATWPVGLLDQLVADGVLTPTSNAKSIACDACGDDHVELVQFVEAPPGSELRAYIACPENGRVRVPLDRLRRWSVNLESVQPSAGGEPASSGFKLPDNLTITSTSSMEFLPTPSANDPKGLRDAANYCRAQAARLGDARAKWWWTQARVYDADAEKAEQKSVTAALAASDEQPVSPERIWPDPENHTTAKIWTRKDGTLCLSAKTDTVHDGEVEFAPIVAGELTYQMRFMQFMCFKFPGSATLAEIIAQVYPDDLAQAEQDPEILKKTLRKLRSLVSDVRTKKIAKAGLNPDILPPLSVEASINAGIGLRLAHLHRLDDKELDDADAAPE